MAFPSGPYNPQETETRILKYWLDGGFYKPEYDPKQKKVVDTEAMKKDGRETFCIINPPPNAYGRPHLGNISGYAYQDLMGRYWRMQGKKVLLQPGKDHAGIQGEIVVLREHFKTQGKSKQNMTREQFYQETYDYFVENMALAMEDEKRIGLSADYDRNVFTLDPDIVRIILDTFVKMYKDGHVYKGVRIVNWCPSCKTALADIDTEKKDRETELVYIKYPLVGDGFISVATTRPESMLGDTAVVVNPKDERYKKLVGKKAVLPLANREIPIITDPSVDMEFGTGAVKLTPSHAYEDYEIMLRWNAAHPDNHVGYVNVVGKDGRMVGPVDEKYAGQTTDDCRKTVVADLQVQALVEKIEKLEHKVSVCERCKNVIEPIMSSQWFVSVGEIKKEATNVVKEGKIAIHPKYMTKRYLRWMENLRDWPISRSLWWGYRIPAWYKGQVDEETDKNGQIINKIGGVAVNNFKAAVEAGVAKVSIESPGEGWIQDDDVFDTWFSSGQWPYATLMKWDLMDTFYPTQVMETCYDILELWVSRMVMFGLYRYEKIPFADVYLHGMVLGPDGQKMSKSKGNVVPFDDIIKKYGADALRLLYITGNKAGASYRVDERRLEGYKKLLNKIWNSAKFITMNLQDFLDIGKIKREDLKLSSEDTSMLDEISRMKEYMSKQFGKFRFDLVSVDLQQSFWHEFCDKYIESVKNRLYVRDREGNPIEYDKDSRLAAQWTLWYGLREYLKMFHPFIPFVTEAVWQELPKTMKDSETIMYQKWDPCDER